MVKKIVKYGGIILITGLLIWGIRFGYEKVLNEKNAVSQEESVVDVESFDEIIDLARTLSQSDYKAPNDDVPDSFKNLNYDQYRDIRFVRENGPWYNQKLPFEMQFFHVGSMFQYAVPINEIVQGKAKPIEYSSEFFDYGKNNFESEDFKIDGYAGFRIHAPLNTATYYDELIAFLGASYFRALGKGEKYGLSARGLAVDTALQTGEEFPVFREFWIRKPRKYSKDIKLYALLDSPSISGAYSFLVTPGKNTTVKVDAVLFPRKEINKLGIAPLTSMFLFGENTKNKFDDHRPEVHDSDGLLLWNGNDEWLWRPLDNSKYLRVSSFEDNNPKGFGLMQRDKNPEHYLDFESLYDLRPSVWVEPLGNWGEGVVQLVEIPSVQEIHDNVVAFWVPKKKIKAGKEYRFSYKLNWSGDVPFDNLLAEVSATYTGVGGVSGMLETEKRKFVIDFSGAALDYKKDIESGELKPAVSVNEGKIVGTHMIYNPLTKGATVYLDYKPSGKIAEFRVSLQKSGKNVSEVWSYQWLP